MCKTRIYVLRYIQYYCMRWRMGTICADARPQYDVRCAAKSYRTWYEVRIIGHPQAARKSRSPANGGPLLREARLTSGSGCLSLDPTLVELFVLFSHPRSVPPVHCRRMQHNSPWLVCAWSMQIGHNRLIFGGPFDVKATMPQRPTHFRERP